MDTTPTLISVRNRRDPVCFTKRDDQGVTVQVQTVPSGNLMINSAFAPSFDVEIFVYVADNGRARVDVRHDRETALQTLRQIVELYGQVQSIVTRHIPIVLKKDELDTMEISVKHTQDTPCAIIC